MRDRLHGYSPAKLDQLIVRMFFEWPDEAFVARQLGIHQREVTAALERFATRVAVLADQHWQERVLTQVNELQKICDRICEAEDPPHASVALRVRIAALRQSFLANTETTTPAAAVPSGGAGAVPIPPSAPDFLESSDTADTIDRAKHSARAPRVHPAHRHSRATAVT
jgi:hypothetical protein